MAYYKLIKSDEKKSRFPIVFIPCSLFTGESLNCQKTSVLKKPKS